MTQEQIEAVRADLNSMAHGIPPLPPLSYVAKEALAALDHLTTRLSEVERERDEAREMHRVWVEEPEGLRWYMDRASERAARITELEAEVARLTHKLIDVGEMECGKCDAVGVDCGEHHPSWRWLATQARADIATLRAAIAEAVRRADGMSWPDKFGALEAVEPLRNLTKPDTPSERIMSDKDRENPVEGAHPTQPEGEDALVEALSHCDGIGTFNRRGDREVVLTFADHESGMKAFEALEALASRGLVVRGEGVER